MIIYKPFQDIILILYCSLIKLVCSLYFIWCLLHIFHYAVVRIIYGDPRVHTVEDHGDNWCNTIEDDYVSCVPGKPCQHPDQVDLRVIVLIYNRPESLQKVLDHLQDLQVDEGETAVLDIWLDCSPEGRYDVRTYLLARSFKWKHGEVRTHVWRSQVGLRFQWIDTYKPHDGTKESMMWICLHGATSG